MSLNCERASRGEECDMGSENGVASRAILFLLALKSVKLVPIQCVQVSVLLWQGIDLACKTAFPNGSIRMTQSLLFVPSGILLLFSYNEVL